MGLRLLFTDEKSRGTKASCCFSAFFYHPFRRMITVVSGHMEIQTNPDFTKIISVTEEYKKTERQDILFGGQLIYSTFVEPAISWVVEKIRPVTELTKWLLRNILSLGFAAGVAAIVYVNFLHESLSLLTPKGLEIVRQYTPIWFAAGYIIQQMLPALKKTIAPDMSVKKLPPDGDLTEMANQIEHADHVTIVSGDFSFIDIDPRLETCLKSLAFNKKLVLISYKSKESVERELNSKSSGRELLLKLSDDNAIHFGFPVHAKITLVDHGGSHRMIFRFSKEMNGSHEKHMGFIHQTANTPELLKLIQQLVVAARSEAIG